jgi:predicted glutamine amidotransferase
MCVILATREERIPAWAMKRAHAKNPHGIGMAWTHKGAVEWEKSISLKKAIRMAAKLPKPYVVHFRWATVGPQAPVLCHPFPIIKRLTDELRGRNRSVVFHNGTFDEWADELAQRPGIWSDSRALALLLARKGMSTLKSIGDNRVAVVRNNEVSLHGPGWKTTKGFVMSNERWLRPEPRVQMWERHLAQHRNFVWEPRS